MPTLTAVIATLWLCYLFCIVQREGDALHEVTLVHCRVFAVPVVLDTVIFQREDFEIEWSQHGNSLGPKVQGTANIIWFFSYPFCT